MNLGPCIICGDTNYNLSCGGPTICPKCDCGNFDVATVNIQAKELTRLRKENSELAARVLSCNAKTQPSPVVEDARHEVANWMIGEGYVTGHGDTLDDLMRELVTQAQQAVLEGFAQSSLPPTDLVRRLRTCYEKRELPTWGEIDEAAAEIERLRAVLEIIAGSSDRLQALQARAALDNIGAKV